MSDRQHVIFKPSVYAPHNIWDILWLENYLLLIWYSKLTEHLVFYLPNLSTVLMKKEQEPSSRQAWGAGSSIRVVPEGLSDKGHLNKAPKAVRAGVTQAPGQQRPRAWQSVTRVQAGPGNMLAGFRFIPQHRQQNSTSHPLLKSQLFIHSKKKKRKEICVHVFTKLLISAFNGLAFDYLDVKQVWYPSFMMP